MTKRRFCFTFFLLICFSLPLTATAQTVNIPDPNLRAIVENALGKPSGTTITAADMETLTRLFAGNANITDLTGLEHATNLTWLHVGLVSVIGGFLNSNSISDISPIAGLNNLTELNLGGNTISDISSLAGLNNLEKLLLWGNSTSDISPIAGLNNLIELNLGGNSVSDISPIAGLTNLTSLSLWRNSISDISSLVGLNNLAFLNLWDNTISDISPLAGLNNLVWLTLFNNAISDLSPLVANAGLGFLDRVDVRENPLDSVSLNTHIPALQSRRVTVEFSVDFPDPNLRAAIATALGKPSGATITAADMETLTALFAPNANITDLTGLEYATNLSTLDIGAKFVEAEGRIVNSNSVSDISPLAGLNNLTFLLLVDNSITDISPLVGLNNLTTLSVWGNSISDILPLAGLNNLTELYLGKNSISDVSPLAGLNNLTELWLTDNSISDISPLVANTGLGNGDTVNVTENPLNAASINIHISALQSRGVTVEFDDIVAQPADVNGDGTVNIFDLVLVASKLGTQGQNLAADVNGDGIVNILDLVFVAGMFHVPASAPLAQPQAPEMLTAAAVRQWLTDAKTLDIQDPIIERGVVVLQQFLTSLTPRETELLANYPNPFNPETWIPYRLAEDASVTLTIYDGVRSSGQLTWGIRSLRSTRAGRKQSTGMDGTS